MAYQHLRDIDDEEWEILKNALACYRDSDLDMRSYDDPQRMKETEKINNMLRIMQDLPYKGPINIPCSACSEDPKMELHDHSHVAEKDRRI